MQKLVSILTAPILIFIAGIETSKPKSKFEFIFLDLIPYINRGKICSSLY